MKNRNIALAVRAALVFVVVSLAACGGDDPAQPVRAIALVPVAGPVLAASDAKPVDAAAVAESASAPIEASPVAAPAAASAAVAAPAPRAQRRRSSSSPLKGKAARRRLV